MTSPGYTDPSSTDRSFDRRRQSGEAPQVVGDDAEVAFVAWGSTHIPGTANNSQLKVLN